MDKQFDFKQVGKRMPYSVPDDFFDKLEADVMARVKDDENALPVSRSKALHIALRSAVAVAAAIALLFMVTKHLPLAETMTDDSFAYVELAYNNLSTEDQDFLLSVYEEDFFMNEQTNIEEQ